MNISDIGVSLDFDLKQPYFLVTYHPVTLGEEPPEQSFLALLEALDMFKEHQVILTYPNADDGGRRIIPILESYAKQQPNRVCAISSLGQKRYLSTVKNAAAVIGNSSSGIIEVPAFNVPTVNIGVRQKGRLAAKSVLNCIATEEAISAAIESAVTGSYKLPDEIIINPYGAGNASAQAIQMLKSLEFEPSKPFYDLK